MYISAREREIIELLLDNCNGISIQEVAKHVQVSNRTVYRELKGIERILSDYKLLLKKLPVKGLFIEGDSNQINELRITLLRSGQEFTQRERRELILCALLKESDSVKLTTLANELNVTVATVSNDLTRLEEWLGTFDLEPIRKKGYGITLQGSEKQKRKALGSLITEKLNEYEFLEVVENSDEVNRSEISHKLLEIIKLEKMTIVGKVIRDIEEKLSYSLADNSYMSLTIHLSLALERMMQGETITMESELLKELKESKEFFMANQIAKELEEIFLIRIPETEKGYITMHLQGARVREKKNDWLEEGNLTILVGTKKLISYVSEQLNINFEKDIHLFEGLVTHIEPAIYRIQKKLGVQNPLTEQIKKDYPTLFSTIQEGLKVAFPTIKFNNKEIAYLVLHFGSSQEIYGVEKDFRALVICSSGIGSSKMLASRIKKEVKEITDIDISALYHLKDIDIEQYDIILSTIEMPGFSKKYLQVNPLLTKDDITKIQKEIHINYHFKTKEERLLKSNPPLNVEKKKVFETPEVIKERIEAIQIYSETVLHIINTFQTYSLSPSTESVILLAEACNILSEDGLIENPSEILDHLLEREEKGGLGIPGTEIALYHCRSDYIKKPLFVSFTLQEPITIKAMDGNEIQVIRLLLLLAPAELPSTQLEVLSMISSTIIESEESIRTFTFGSDEEISQILIYTFEEELQKK